VKLNRKQDNQAEKNYLWTREWKRRTRGRQGFLEDKTKSENAGRDDLLAAFEDSRGGQGEEVLDSYSTKVTRIE